MLLLAAKNLFLELLASCQHFRSRPKISTTSTIQNLLKKNDDPFSEDALDDGPSSDRFELIHIRILQRNMSGRKTTTIVQGLKDDPVFLKTILRSFKKEFACNGCVTEHEKYGLVISLQGDHRSGVSETLVKTGICRHDQIKEHGF